MGKKDIQALLAQLAQKDAELASERKAKRNHETRSSIQIIKLADNNASLARTNNRLNYQLEKLRKEHDQLIHLHTGQQAVTKAKIGEFKTEIKELKELLKESLDEKESLLSHLQAKQEIIKYLEWRLGQMQSLVDGRQRTTSESANRNYTLSPAFETPRDQVYETNIEDSFIIYPDENSSLNPTKSRASAVLGKQGSSVQQPGNTVTEVIDELNASQNNKENNPKSSDTPIMLNITYRTSLEGGLHRRNRRSMQGRSSLDNNIPRDPLSEITPEQLNERDGFEAVAGQRLQFSSAREHVDTNWIEERRSPSKEENTNKIQAALRLASPPCIEASSTTTRSSTAFSKQEQPQQKETKIFRNDTCEITIDNNEVNAEMEKRCEANEDVQNGNQNCKAVKTPRHGASHLDNCTPSCKSISSHFGNDEINETHSNRRSCTRSRRISYTLPSLNSKLRQGDPFTFGDPNTISRPKRSSKTAKTKGSGKKKDNDQQKKKV